MADGQERWSAPSPRAARSKWIPRIALGIGLFVLGYAIVSLSVGEGGPQGQDIEGFEQTQQLFGGIPQEDAYVGPDDAATTITVFTDLRCDPCDSWQVDEIDPLVEEYARTEKARLELRHLSLGENPTTLAAIAATAAGQQGHQWQFADVLARNLDLAPQNEVGQEFLREIAEAVPGLDVDEWEADLDSPEVKARVESDGETAVSLRLPTLGPSVVVEGPSGTRTLEDYPQQDEIESAVAAVG